MQQRCNGVVARTNVTVFDRARDRDIINASITNVIITSLPRTESATVLTFVPCIPRGS
jgi:hypothetical protein